MDIIYYSNTLVDSTDISCMYHNWSLFSIACTRHLSFPIFYPLRRRQNYSNMVTSTHWNICSDIRQLSHNHAHPIMRQQGEVSGSMHRIYSTRTYKICIHPLGSQIQLFVHFYEYPLQNQPKKERIALYKLFFCLCPLQLAHQIVLGI